MVSYLAIGDSFSGMPRLNSVVANLSFLWPNLWIWNFQRR